MKLRTMTVMMVMREEDGSGGDGVVEVNDKYKADSFWNHTEWLININTFQMVDRRMLKCLSLVFIGIKGLMSASECRFCINEFTHVSF